MTANDSRHSVGLLDTGVLIARAHFSESDLPAEVAISAISLGELAAGVHAISGSTVTANQERARRTVILQQVEFEFDPIPYTAQTARVFGALCAAVFAMGRKPRGRSLDLMIAATASVEQVPLYTTNPRDFTGLESYVDVVPLDAAQ